MNSTRQINGIKLAVWFLLAYYCLYEFKTRYTIISSQVVDITVGVTALFIIGIILLTSLSGGKIRISSNYGLAICWIPFILVVLYQTLKYECAKSYFLLFVLFGMMLASEKLSLLDWSRVCKVIRIMACVVAVGVLIQFFLPSLHNVIMKLFYNDTGISYVNNFAAKGYYSGILHQVGDAAYYLFAGLIVELFGESNKKRRNILIILFLFALILQGKRSIVVFGIIDLLIVYLLSGIKGKFIQRTIQAILVLFFIILLIYLCLPLLRGTVIYSKMSAIIPFLINGDITGVIDETSRLDLYNGAISLYRSAPLMGIGWGNFVQNSTSFYDYATSTHNVYLQLLCETGIIGLCSFILGQVSLIVILFKTRRKMLLKTSNLKENNIYWLWAIGLSGQIMFILFCMSENPLYNENCLLLYMISSLVGVVAYQASKNENMKIDRPYR